MDYERGLAQLKQLLRGRLDLQQEFQTLEFRLIDNLHTEHLYGTTEQLRADRARVIDQLNRLAKQAGTNFNDLCRPTSSSNPNFQTPPKSNQGSSPNTQSQRTSSQPASQRTIAYISFHPSDKSYLDELHKQLDFFARQGLKYWDRMKLMPGVDQQVEITKALQSTRVAIVLVSADYLAAEPPDFIASYELPTLVPAAHKKEITILSVIIRPCAFAYSDLEPFHPVNPPDQPLSDLNQSKRAKIWQQIAVQVHDLLSK
jgi:hypothetical protein